MSKTERALDEDEAALDDFVAAEAAEADRAIGELIDEAVEPRNGAAIDGDAPIGNNGLDTGDIDRPAPGLDAAGERSEPAVDEPADVVAAEFDEIELTESDVFTVAESDTLRRDDVELDEDDPLDDGGTLHDVGDDGTGDLELDDEVATDSFELLHLDALIETDDGIVDDEVLPEPEADIERADREDIDDDLEADDDVEADDDEYELPEIVPATADDIGVDADDGDLEAVRGGNGAGPAAAAAGLTPPVGLTSPSGQPVPAAREASDDILEELRRADIDGPIVDFAPQDDTTSARRRPKRRADYDPAPVPIPARPPRVLSRKPRVRKVTRVVRHVDPWSVFKIAIMAFLVLYVILLTAGVLLWNVAHATGTVDNVERFFESFGWSTFEFNGGEIYHAAWIGGLFAVIGFTGVAVLTATLFNLITDIVGGMRFTVLEEEVVETRTSPMRRFVIRRPEPEVPALIHDNSGPMIREAVVDDSGAIDRRRG